MSLSESLLPEFDHEMANTRKTIERVPEDILDWKPHEKSWAMGGLATHLATLPNWAVIAIGQDAFDRAPPGAPPPRNPQITSTAEALKIFDKNVTDARAAIAGASDEHLFKPWTLLSGGQTILTMPRIAVLRSFVMNHMIHHRAQLGVYLRLNDVPVPAIYGPSADEGGM
ncbi:MAG: DinB family protein [Acidobacteria bacterium]|nr:DinB family protein [Acidobacteriota bacterium]